jgi:asparagine synthase (glutamine-hydrolysing)
MCGICGFTGIPDRQALQRMTDAMMHRGPDEAGFWESGDVSLGMRRLAIIDLETGQQPIFNEDATVGVVFNGEIYNYPELQAELKAQGHRFRTDHSDTEVLVHPYEQYGDAFLHKLNGMFAIALWDLPRRRLFLARDRAGIKPLYFSLTGGCLIFASEIKSILQHPAVSREPDFAALSHYLSLKNVPSPWSAFHNISQLGPGQSIAFENGELNRRIWWRPIFAEDDRLGEQEAAVRVRELLEDAVRLQMRADVPFGAYLSGGVDSSSVVALMTKIGGRRVTTFSLVYSDGFENKAADQTYARLVSREFGTDHHEYVLSYREAADSIDAVLDAFDEPFSGVTSTFFITKLIAKHVKVALSGDGADELFGSYLAHRLAQPLYQFGQLRAREASTMTSDELSRLAPYSDKLDYLAALFDRGDEVDRRASLYLWTDAEKNALLTDKMRALSGGAQTRDLVAKRYAEASTHDPLNRALYCDFLTLLPDQVLAFVDRLSMAHSVEVRPPFLDHRLIEFAATIPGELKIRNGREKNILKEAVRGLIPQAVIDRRKEGFVLPMDHWLLHNLRGKVEETLAPARLAAHGLLRPDRVRAVLDAHYARTANHGPRIWNLMMFQLWWEKFFAVSLW